MLHSTMKEDGSKGALANRTDSVTADDAVRNNNNNSNNRTIRISNLRSSKSGRRNISVFQEEMFRSTFASGLTESKKVQMNANYKQLKYLVEVTIKEAEEQMDKI